MSEENEQINIKDFVTARNREIKEIEKSIQNRNKKSLLWQRVPHYKRRRCRSYENKPKNKKNTKKKDRHYLRTHTFYSKRFFMLKISEQPKILIPYKRRVKNDKFIYKSFNHSGFVFDENFRGVSVFEWAGDQTTLSNTNLFSILL